MKMVITIQKNKNIYWRRISLMAFMFFSMIMANAQYNITAMLPSGGIYLRSQLWNMSVSNTGTLSVEVVLQLEMKDIHSHQTVLSATSGDFSLAPGIRAIQANIIEPVQYESQNATTDQSSNGFLPVGQYMVCYQLFQIGHNVRYPLAEDCEQLEVEPFSPPILTQPENDSVVETATPYFTWVPPAPAAMFTDLNYNVLISEVYDGQSINEAIQKNLPLQQLEGLQQPFLTFPLQGPQLEKGKKYAWQVIVLDQQTFAARSEVWSFRMGDKKDSALSNSTIFLLMDGRSSGIGTIDTATLHIKYISYESAHNAAIVFKDINGSVINKISKEIKQGDNYLNFPLNRKFKSKKNYTISIVDTNGKTSTLTFSIK